jgi:hypothetical protein
MERILSYMLSLEISVAKAKYKHMIRNQNRQGSLLKRTKLTNSTKEGSTEHFE